MPFPPPTDGFVEPTLSDTLTEYLVPKPSSTLWHILESDFDTMKLVAGDLIVLERDRPPHQGCLAVVEYLGDTFLCQLHYQKKTWFAVTDERKGKVPEDMCIIGIATKLAKNQLT